jgi:hypothetical protein
MLALSLIGAFIAGFLLGAWLGVRDGRWATIEAMREVEKTIVVALGNATDIIEQARRALPMPQRIEVAQRWIETAIIALKDLPRHR